MTFYSKVGSFTAPASTGSQTTTGVGFTPTFVIMWSTGQTATGWGAQLDQGIGFMTAADVGSVAAASKDAVTTTVTSRNMRVSPICMCWGTNDYLEATLTNFTSDGWVLNWTTTNSGEIINYLAIGGTDIVGAKMVTWKPSAGTGAKSVTHRRLSRKARRGRSALSQITRAPSTRCTSAFIKAKSGCKKSCRTSLQRLSRSYRSKLTRL